MEKPSLTIHPLDLGTITNFDKSLFTLRHNQGVMIDIACLAWVIKGGGQTLLVDTGPCDPERSRRYHRALQRRPDQELGRALAAIGVAEEIPLRVFTHLPLGPQLQPGAFPRATFLGAGSGSWPTPRSPDRGPGGLRGGDPGRRAALAAGARPPPDRGRRPGGLPRGPGDAPARPHARVSGRGGRHAGGPLVIAGDTIPLYDNWHQRDWNGAIFGGIYQSILDYEASYRRILALGGTVLHRHDPRCPGAEGLSLRQAGHFPSG
jgi:hypothetical protein